MASPIAGFGFTTNQARNLEGLASDLDRIQGLGASHAELSLFAADVVSGSRPIASRVAKLRSICEGSNLGFTVHGPLAGNFMDPDHGPLFAGAVAAYIEICGAVGATAMVLHTGVVKNRPEAELDDLHALEREHLHRLGDLAADAGVKLAVETLFTFDPALYTATPKRLAKQIEAVGHSHVVGTLDVSHAFLNSDVNGLDPVAGCKTFAKVAGHAHLHDSFGRKQTVHGFTGSENVAFGQGDLHLPFGWGSLPFETLLPELEFLPGTVLNIELPPYFADEAADCAAAVQRWMA